MYGKPRVERGAHLTGRAVAFGQPQLPRGDRLGTDLLAQPRYVAYRPGGFDLGLIGRSGPDAVVGGDLGQRGCSGSAMMRREIDAGCCYQAAQSIEKGASDVRIADGGGIEQGCYDPIGELPAERDPIGRQRIQTP